MMLKLPDYYNQLAPMPKDPPNSVSMEAENQHSHIYVIMFPVQKRQCMPFDDPQKVIDVIHRNLTDEQGLIEVDTGKTVLGKKYIYNIKKCHGDTSGVLYILTCNTDDNEACVHLQGFFDETGAPGIRSGSILAQSRFAGIVSEDLEGWAEDPYDPEYKNGALMNLSEHRKFDSAFPSHPLSMARELVRYIAENN
ncbi:MAG: hypothetical protein IJ130_04635 [Solobacterium sp.]|nr:hypothetical protein [Solobacterium sp.]